MEPNTGNGWPVEELQQLIESLSAIRCEMTALERQFAPEIAKKTIQLRPVEWTPTPASKTPPAQEP
jgi:hypothetical protein